ncbi:MAG TPA: branched-chain amino acid ABC transporter permease [Actinomycetota bacterium]
MKQEAAPEPPDVGPGQVQRRLMRLPLRSIILWLLSITLLVGVVWGSWKTLDKGTFTTSDWQSFIVDGVARGSVYALIAMGYTLVYGILFMINFAHGEVFMSGTFTAYFMARWMDQTGFLNSQPIVAIGVLLLVSMVVSTTVAVALERVAYRPLRGAPRLVPLITAIGASLFLQNSFRGFYGAQATAYPQIDILRGAWEFLGWRFQRTEVVAIVGAFLLMAGLYWFIKKTRTGRSMRAVGEDKETSALMGIDVDRTIVSTFAIGGLLAGAAGILFIFLFNQVKFDMGFIPGIKAFTAAVLGGIGNVAGAGIGGLLLGVFEAVGPFLLLEGFNVPSPNQLQLIIAFGILVLVLIFRPGGLLGSTEGDRA